MLLTVCLKDKKEWLFPDRLRSFLIRRVKINISPLLAFQAFLWLIKGKISVLDRELCGNTARNFSLSQCIRSVSLKKKRKDLRLRKAVGHRKESQQSKGRHACPRKVLAGGLSILAIKSVFPVLHSIIAECQ